ncbi:diguanylate cyclase [bacterium]|nr:diguanylate cyclase [bacterium]
MNSAQADLIDAHQAMVVRLALADVQGALVVQSPDRRYWQMPKLMQLKAQAQFVVAMVRADQAAQARLARATDMARTLAAFDVGLFTFDVDQDQLSLDATAAQVIGLNGGPQSTAVSALTERLIAEHQAGFYYRVNRALTLGQRERYSCQTLAGRWLSIGIVRDLSDDQRRCVLGIVRDYTDVREIELESEQHQAQLEGLVRKLRSSNRTDPLTELANRIELTERLSVISQAAKSAGGVVSMMVMDIDNFKSYNDSFGHAAGDDRQLLSGAMLDSFAQHKDVTMDWRTVPHHDPLSSSRHRECPPGRSRDQAGTHAPRFGCTVAIGENWLGPGLVPFARLRLRTAPG